jgi:hypothetical protein
VWARPQAAKPRPVLQPYKPVVVKAPAPPPGRWWYALSVLILAGGMAWFAMTVLTSTAGITDNLTQVVLPGRVSLTLEPGRYTIYHETQSVVNGKTYANPPVVGVALSLRAAAGNREVPLSRPRTPSEYTVSGRSGSAFLEFAIDQRGVYQLTGAYPRNRKGPELVFAVGQGLTSDVARALEAGLPTLFGSVLLAALAAVVVATVRRRRGA